MRSLPEVKVLKKVIRDTHTLHTHWDRAKKAFSSRLSCITSVCRALSLTHPPHPHPSTIKTPHFISRLGHKVTMICLCPSRSHRGTHSSWPVLQPLAPPPPPPSDYVIDTEWMGWRQLGSGWLSPFSLAGYGDVMSGWSHTEWVCVGMCGRPWRTKVPQKWFYAKTGSSPPSLLPVRKKKCHGCYRLHVLPGTFMYVYMVAWWNYMSIELFHILPHNNKNVSNIFSLDLCDWSAQSSLYLSIGRKRMHWMNLSSK